MGLVFSTACVLACYLYLTTEHRRADKNVTSAFSSCYDTSPRSQNKLTLVQSTDYCGVSCFTSIFTR